MIMSSCYYKSPIGIIQIKGDDNFIFSIDFIDNSRALEEERPNDNVKSCAMQLEEYFKGNRKNFKVNLYMKGTEFQKKVWMELAKIPYATTVSYKYIAENIGNEKAVRAVGLTNGKNPVSIIVPCHRVIGANGKLTGYAGGLWRKQWLLEHEVKYKI